MGHHTTPKHPAFRVGATPISKRAFYVMGGFSNPNLFRKHDGRAWRYYRKGTEQ